MITLHHSHAAERFRKPSRNFAGNFWPRPENRANRLEGPADPEAKHQQNQESQARHRHARMNQVDQRDRRRHKSAGEFHQSGADQIADSFDVAHDPRNQHPGLVRVVERNGKPPDMCLHLPSQFGDHLLRRFGKKLRQAEGSESLHERRAENGKNDRRQ